jgi:hypothetical protein
MKIMEKNQIETVSVAKVPVVIQPLLQYVKFDMIAKELVTHSVKRKPIASKRTTHARVQMG